MGAVCVLGPPLRRRPSRWVVARWMAVAASGCIAVPLDVGPAPSTPRREPAETPPEAGLVSAEATLTPVRIGDPGAQLRWIVAQYFQAVSVRSLQQLRRLLLPQAVVARSMHEPGQRVLSVWEDRFRQPRGDHPLESWGEQTLQVGVFTQRQVVSLARSRPLSLTPEPGQVLVTAQPHAAAWSNATNPSVELLLQREPDGWRIARVLELRATDD